MKRTLLVKSLPEDITKELNDLRKREEYLRNKVTAIFSYIATSRLQKEMDENYKLFDKPTADGRTSTYGVPSSNIQSVLDKIEGHEEEKKELCHLLRDLHECDAKNTFIWVKVERMYTPDSLPSLCFHHNSNGTISLYRVDERDKEGKSSIPPNMEIPKTLEDLKKLWGSN